MASELMFTLDELWQKLDEFEAELVQAELKPSSVETYVERTKFFLRWLGGDYHPRVCQELCVSGVI